MGGEIGIEGVRQFPQLRRLRHMAAQPFPEAVELGMLQVPQLRGAQCPAPEADLDLRLQVALGVQGECFEHDDMQRLEPGQPGRCRVHPRPDPAVGHHQGRAEDVGFAVEVMREDSARAVGFAGDRPDGRPRDPVPRDDPPGG
jgi:hypothetical protein